MPAEIHVGDVGTVFKATVRDENGDLVDISTATRTMKFRKPDGTVMPKTATLVTDGLDGEMQYASIAGDLNLPGIWKVQGLVVIGTGTWHTDTYQFTVHKNLS